MMRWMIAVGLLLASNVSAQTDASAPANPFAPAVTPTSLPGTEAHLYRDGETPVRLFVAKPEGWKAGDRRPAYLFFFGGGFIRGTPERSIGTARMLTKHGFVGIAPDYRTRERFGTNGVACIADARKALQWVQDHADELGIDPTKIVVGGSSAGGSLALWTAINASPEGVPAVEAPRVKPAGLVLFSAPTDVGTSRRAYLFTDDPMPYSPLQNLDASTPPVLAFHGDADPTVGYEDAVKLEARLKELGCSITLVTVPGGNHGFRTQFPEWKTKSDEMVVEFVRHLELIPAGAGQP
jgi:acetyl esterase